MQKGRHALVMLTDYSRNQESDARLLNLIGSRYEKIFVFPQGKFDLPYLESFQLRWQVVDRDFNALNRFIRDEPSFDYIGTRLHGGIHCLNHRRRALILEVDNRAKEIGRDTGLPTVPRDDLEAVRRWIDEPPPFRIRLPVANIERWRNQFAQIARQAKASL